MSICSCQKQKKVKASLCSGISDKQKHFHTYTRSTALCLNSVWKFNFWVELNGNHAVGTSVYSNNSFCKLIARRSFIENIFFRLWYHHALIDFTSSMLYPHDSLTFKKAAFFQLLSAWQINKRFSCVVEKQLLNRYRYDLVEGNDFVAFFHARREGTKLKFIRNYFNLSLNFS